MQITEWYVLEVSNYVIKTPDTSIGKLSNLKLGMQDHGLNWH